MSVDWFQQVEELALGGADCVAELERVAAAAPPSHAAVALSLRAVWTGHMEAETASEVARTLLRPLLQLQSKDELKEFDMHATMGDSIRALLAAGADDPVLAQAQLLQVAVAALQDFIANNYTGPPTKNSKLIEHWPSEMTEYANEWASLKLRMVSQPMHRALEARS